MRTRAQELSNAQAIAASDLEMQEKQMSCLTCACSQHSIVLGYKGNLVLDERYLKYPLQDCSCK